MRKKNACRERVTFMSEGASSFEGKKRADEGMALGRPLKGGRDRTELGDDAGIICRAAW